MTGRRTLVAGVDSSTQSCKVEVRDAATGELVRSGRAGHPEGTEVDPDAWWQALSQALAQAGVDASGGPEGDVVALSVGGQQHGMVCLDDSGAVVRPALLWNDTRSAGAARDLVADLGGPQAWADRVGLVPVASFTVSKLRWLADHEPDQARRTGGVCLPHDWLTWRLSGSGPDSGAADLGALTTDRSDASGTGYWSAPADGYDLELLELGLGHRPQVPTVAGPAAVVGHHGSLALGAGCGDNAGAALGLGAGPGDVVVSLGTSGVASAVSDVAARDASGAVAGFADATGRFLPLVATLNATQVLDVTCRMLGVDFDGLSSLALSAPSGADGLVLVPYLQGERTPDRPDSAGALHGLTLANTTPAHLARAAVEGLLCGLADGIDALVAQGSRVDRVLLVGGGAASEAVRRIAPIVLGRPVEVPAPAEYVARGAARQAAWAWSGSEAPPDWVAGGGSVHEASVDGAVRERYAEARDLTVARV